MKSLFESILKSVGAGKKEWVRKWCEENIDKTKSGDETFDITNDGEVTSKCVGKGSFGKPAYLPTYFLKNVRVPDYVCFAHDVPILWIGDAIKTMSANQLPKWVHELYFVCKEVPKMTIEIGSAIRFRETVEKINPITVIANKRDSQFDYINVDVEAKNCTKEDFENIKVISNGHRVYINISGETKYGAAISRKARKIDKDTNHDLKAIDEYMRSLITNFENVQGLTIRFKNSSTRFWLDDKNNIFRLDY